MLDKIPQRYKCDHQKRPHKPWRRSVLIRPYVKLKQPLYHIRLFFQNQRFQKKNQENHQIVKQFGPRSGPTKRRA